MPNSTLPPDNYLGDPGRTTGEFQDQINNLQNWVNTLQAELQALSGTTVREGAVRQVNGGAGPLRANIGTGDTVQFGRITDTASPGDGDFDSDKLGYWEATVELGGDFDAGESVKVVRVGNMVVITATSTLTHASDSSLSSANTIPSWGRPSDGVDNVCLIGPSTVAQLGITALGDVRVNYRDWNGSAVNRTSLATLASIAYTV